MSAGQAPPQPAHHAPLVTWKSRHRRAEPNVISAMQRRHPEVRCHANAGQAPPRPANQPGVRQDNGRQLSPAQSDSGAVRLQRCGICHQLALSTSSADSTRGHRHCSSRLLACCPGYCPAVPGATGATLALHYMTCASSAGSKKARPPPGDAVLGPALQCLKQQGSTDAPLVHVLSVLGRLRIHLLMLPQVLSTSAWSSRIGKGAALLMLCAALVGCTLSRECEWKLLTC